ncbi:site-specific integrase [Bradyrhizobium sp. AUGA SZCCT0051]|nr:site-specific integrase [Bradyrhizobium sp. AUGA SZCCT0124]MBR1313530.1 site-specific integrase [Bradyrhizobium sp. AUGA SZCCT0051]MBR1343373.1 site-specific integrase [Bradyrhizobium sp. AUGA SZCCT0105]MBR1357207.1 site-specific integrase [Bradyrhizobium sp. AUGA SZCCT0045]
MSVYRDKRSQYWQYEFQIKGHRFYGSTRSDNEREARAIEEEEKRKARANVEHWIAASREPLTLKRACDRWWDEHGQNLADLKIKSALDRIVEILGGKIQLHDIVDDTVAHLVAERRRDRRRDRTVVEKGKPKILYRAITNSTVNRTLDLLRRVMRRAKENWNTALPNEPTWKKHRLKPKKRPVRELLASEEKRLDQVEDFDFVELRRFAIITGLRRQNLLLKWSQVNFEHGTISIVTKGDEPRIMPLSREAYAILWRRRGHHKEFVFTYKAKRTWKNRTRKGRKLGDLVKGQRYPITAAGFSSHKDRAWSKADVDARIHDLRHTAGMRTLRTTGNLRIVQELLGHSTIAVTSEFYTGATVEDVREAMERTAEAQQRQRELLEAIERQTPKAIENKGGDE